MAPSRTLDGWWGSRDGRHVRRDLTADSRRYSARLQMVWKAGSYRVYPLQAPALCIPLHSLSKRLSRCAGVSSEALR